MNTKEKNTNKFSKNYNFQYIQGTFGAPTDMNGF